MLRPHRLTPRSDIGAEFVEADLHAGFALLDCAEDESLFGTPDGARRAISEAECACADCQLRLSGLNATDLERFQPEFEKLRAAIDGMKRRFPIPPWPAGL